MQRHSDLILLVHSKHQNVSDLVYYFHSENHAWEEADRLDEAAQRTARAKYSLIVCCWEFMQASTEQDVEKLEDMKGLLTSSTPLIFLSENQSAAVTFKTYLGRCFYSLRKSEFVNLFAIIAELAIQIHEDRNRCPRLQEASPPPGLAAPHVSPALFFDRAMMNSSIHSLF